jgi:cytochrome P450
MLPPFHGERVQAYRRVVAELAEAEVASWPRGEAFAALPHMQGLTLDVIMRAVFGEREEPALRDALRARARHGRLAAARWSRCRSCSATSARQSVGDFMRPSREVDDALRR